MSLRVEHVYKSYGSQFAVSDVNFEVAPGEIVGFLGPNGAGKSTTMKMATAYLPPTSGTITVAGYNVVSQPLAVKKILGYLAEHNPLYLDMYVHEYLRFIGSLYGLKGRSLTSRVDEMIEMCGLTIEQNKLIQSLSKGYRQRVGLAQALIHDPAVLILDEPTTGLDPNQIIEIRNLIRSISKNKTVVFSTHIMQEVQALCDRVIIINRGQIVSDSSLSALMDSSTHQQSVIVAFNLAIAASELRLIEGVVEVEDLGGGNYRLIADKTADLRPAVFRFSADKNLPLVSLKEEENSLENIFKQLTSTSIRHDSDS